MFARSKNRIVIERDDPARCGCNDAYRVVEKDGSGRVVRIHGEGIRSYGVAENIADVARGG